MSSVYSKILVTGGAGFAGSTIAIAFKQSFPQCEVVALDNLKRRGSELILNRLRENDIKFLHGDIRCVADFPSEPFDLLVECSAEPSVLAGYGSSPEYLVGTNLTGAFHCLEYCRRFCPRLIFISTSRVYSVRHLSGLVMKESETRFVLQESQLVPGASQNGINEDFPTSAPRSLYGATKLAAEMLIEEYRHAYGLKAVINRCGVLAGPWQMGKGDQGIFSFWLASHYFNRPLRYIGFNGSGKQVRDLLHSQDLADLVVKQAGDLERWDGLTLNVGGGNAISLSLLEATRICQELTGKNLSIGHETKDRPMDIPSYITDDQRLRSITDWRPQRDARVILQDILRWIQEHEKSLRHIL